MLNYIGERWHKWKQPVAPAAIQAIRTETADRKTPWTPEELKVLRSPCLDGIGGNLPRMILQLAPRYFQKLVQLRDPVLPDKMSG